MDTTEQYRLVHQAIQAIAAVCDGARERDLRGFDGTDTKYGKRIASVPFETLTQDDREEEARIVVKYRKQAEAYTGVDVTTLDVVKDAEGAETNYVSRQNARTYERQARTAHLRDERKAEIIDGKVAIFWVKGDPDFGALLTAVKALPGRTFDWGRKCNLVPATADVLSFLDAWDIEATPEILALAEQTAQAAADKVNVYVQDGRICIEADYDANRVAEARQLPGRRWNAAAKRDEVDPTPEVIRFAQRWNLTVSEEALDLCSATGERPVAATDDRRSLLRAASGAKSPADLPEGFLALLRG